MLKQLFNAFRKPWSIFPGLKTAFIWNICSIQVFTVTFDTFMLAEQKIIYLKEIKSFTNQTLTDILFLIYNYFFTVKKNFV